MSAAVGKLGAWGEGETLIRAQRHSRQGSWQTVMRVGARVLVAVAAGLLLLLPAGGALGRDAVATSPPVVPNELIVGFKSSTPGAEQAAAVRQAGGSAKKHFRQIDAILVRASDADGVGEALAKNPNVRYVEPNYVVSIAATPNDTRYNELWGMNNTGQTGGTPDADIDAPEAWNVETGSSSVVVNVIDTGVDFSHPDLAGRQWVNTGENCGSIDPTIVCLRPH